LARRSRQDAHKCSEGFSMCNAPFRWTRGYVSLSLALLVLGVIAPATVGSQPLPLLVPDEILSPDASDPVLEPSPFGLYIAVDGDTALVSMSARGAPGRVRVYSRLSTGEWQRSATIVAPNTHFDDEFGSGVALEGDVAVIRGDGGYFVFRRTAAGWIN